MEELANDSSSGAFTLKHCAFSMSSAIISARRACGHDSRSKTSSTSMQGVACNSVPHVPRLTTISPPCCLVLSHVLHLAELGPAELFCMGSDRLHVLRVIVRLAFVLFHLECQISCEVFLHVFCFAVPQRAWFHPSLSSSCGTRH